MIVSSCLAPTQCYSTCNCVVILLLVDFVICEDETLHFDVLRDVGSSVLQQGLITFGV